jgi:hypothetical protein
MYGWWPTCEKKGNLSSLHKVGVNVRSISTKSSSPYNLLCTYPCKLTELHRYTFSTAKLIGTEKCGLPTCVCHARLPYPELKGSF